MLEIDGLGLERQDRRYMETLYNVFAGGPAGLSSLAHSMSVPPDTLEDDVEPFLLRTGLIQRTPRGRVLTANGYEHLGKAYPVAGTQTPQPSSQKKLF